MISWPSAGTPSGIDLQGEAVPARDGAAANPAGRASAWPGLLLLAGLICLLTAGALLLRQGSRPSGFRLSEPATHAQREAGFALYRANCASCHGAFLSGTEGWRADQRLAPALNEAGHAMNHDDVELFRRVAAGARGPDGRVTMPAFRGVLSDEEIVSVLSYVLSWWPEEERLRRAGPDWAFTGACLPAQAEAPAPATVGR